MMTAIRSCAQQGRNLLKKLSLDPRVHRGLRIAQCILSGFLLSAASLGQYAQPLALAAVCTGSAWPAVLTALGGSLGYWLFWGKAGFQGIAWLVLGLVPALIADFRPVLRSKGLLLPTVASLITAVTGLVFQLRFGDTTPLLIYLLRILLAPAVTWLCLAKEQRPTPLTGHLIQGIWVLALAQIMPWRWLCLGMAAAGVLCSAAPFPSAALAGLALDLAQVTPVPMTAVACLVCFLRQIPGLRKGTRLLMPTLVYPVVMGLCGHWDILPLPALAAGGLLGSLWKEQAPTGHRRGETGIAQVRLELTAGVFSQMQQLLLEAELPPIDERSLVHRAADRACGSCPCRKNCKEREAAALLPSVILHRPLLDVHDLGLSCRKEGRLLQEMHRAQEQLRTIRGGREQQKEYRGALIQQYQFLREYLQDLSDELGKRGRSAISRFKPQISVCANRKEADNGDRFQSFSGPGCCHYVLLCDGMGTGIGAIDEGRNAASLLKKLLCGGFPPEYALRTLNSLCALRGLAGAITVDLAQLQLDTGKVQLYKWGAAASYLLRPTGTEKIGTAVPPPGLSVTEARETVERLSLRRGETLVMCSDGVRGEEVLHDWYCAPDEPPGELAARILKLGAVSAGDDATVAVVRLLVS